MRERLDVLFYAPWIGPLLAGGGDLPPGGAETQVMLLSQALAADGHRVGVVTYDLNGTPLPHRVGDVRVIVQRRPRTAMPVLRTLAYARGLVSALYRTDAAVVVQRAAGTATGIVALLVKARRRRFVYSSANVVDFDFGTLEPKRRNLAIYHAGVRAADEVVVQTDEQRALCRGRFGRDPVVIKSIAEPAPAPAAAPSAAFLWVGRLTHYKRPLAYVELARAVPEARFRMVVVPFGDEGQRLHREILAAAAVLPNLEVLDARPRAELLPLVDEAVAMVNTAQYEGMPNVFLEGWTRGVPALALHHDPDGVIAREGVGAYAGGDPERFAAQARELWTRRADRGSLSEPCLAYVARDHAPRAVAGRWAQVLSPEAG